MTGHGHMKEEEEEEEEEDGCVEDKVLRGKKNKET
jgi:hypothetical protein